MTRVLPAILVVLGCSGPGPSRPKGGTPSGGTGSAVSGAPSGGTTPTWGRMEQSGVIGCDDPSARATAPFSHTVYGEAWPKTADYRTPEWTLMDGGRGVVVDDFDGDGHYDLLVPRDLFPSRFLRGDGQGGFAEADQWFGGVDAMGFNGAASGDLDGDGDPDAFLYGLMGDATLLINEGDHFEVVDRSEWDTGDAPFGCGGAAAWADYDRDGDLDLFYGRLGGSDPFTGEIYQCDSHLLDNDGAGGLVPHPGQISEDVQRIRVMAAGWYDLDDNGWLDLYTVSDAPPMRNYLLANDQGVLSQWGSNGVEVITEGMGLGVGDLNEDGIPDLTISGIREIPTLISDRDLGIWIESSTAIGLEPAQGTGRTIAWGGDFADLDNDGFLDAVFTYGGVFGTALPKAQPNDLYRNRGDGTFEHVGDAWGWNDQNVGRGAITVDLDGDGWLDIVERELAGVVTVSLAACGEGAWLQIRLHDEEHPNHAAIGARITVFTEGRELTRWIEAGSRSYCSGGPPVAHFGLGSAEAVDRIAVRWPTGEEELYEGVATRQFLDLWRSP